MEEPQNASGDCDSKGAGESVDLYGIRGELMLAAKAIKEEWPIPERLRPYLVQRAELVMRTSGDPKAIARAAQIILAANAQNLKREQMQKDEEYRLREEARQAEKDALGATGGPATAVQVNVTTHSGGVAAVDFSSLLAGATVEEILELEKKFREIAQRQPAAAQQLQQQKPKQVEATKGENL